MFGVFSAHQSKQIPPEVLSEVIIASRVGVDFRFQNRAVAVYIPPGTIVVWRWNDFCRAKKIRFIAS